MSEKIYRLNLWRHGTYKIQIFEVVKRTKKTVTIRQYHEVGDGFRDAHSNYRYALRSQDYAFFDTMKNAKRASENLIVNRIACLNERIGELRERLVHVCRHHEITGPMQGNKCTRCDFPVPNPEDYQNGG